MSKNDRRKPKKYSRAAYRNYLKAKMSDLELLYLQEDLENAGYERVAFVETSDMVTFRRPGRRI